MILVQIFWNKNKGGLFYIPLKVQQEIFKKLGKDSYLKMPKPGTNPRGVEFSKKAIQEMIKHNDTLKISINWLRESINYDSYQKWVEEWNNSL